MWKRTKKLVGRLGTGIDPTIFENVFVLWEAAFCVWIFGCADVKKNREGRASQILVMAERSLEVKLPTICTDGKAEVGRVREEKGRREKIREEKE